ncbi:DNA repair protein rad2 [Malassezia cuniculi]|uniref:DNA repair protein rad2 n=1 Tax=Malassezia cuniculi TaxID=948313 RepID=A0AAF0J617_9BASI|nr:DNA repair protein rad2 [Malassezia cuniculi]
MGLAIDSSIWLYHFRMAMRDPEGKTLTSAHLLGFFWRILKLLYYGIQPVFVFDGGAPVLKRRTLANRRTAKEGARETHARTAEKLLAAQMRAAAVAHVQGKPPSKPVVARTIRDPAKDPFELPQMTSQPIPEKDLRYATEDEIRALMSSIAPEDLDINSPFFQSLPPELQYELVGDLRLQSRGTSYSRLQAMLASAPTPIDFSRAQVAGLKIRNDLTQKVLTVTDEIGHANIQVPVRVAGVRNREYVLIRNPTGEGGFALALRDAGTTQAKAIDVDARESSPPKIEDDEDIPLEEVEIPGVSAADPELDALVAVSDPKTRKERALALLSARAEQHARQVRSERGIEAREELLYGRAAAPAGGGLFHDEDSDDELEMEEVVIQSGNADASQTIHVLSESEEPTATLHGPLTDTTLIEVPAPDVHVQPKHRSPVHYDTPTFEYPITEHNTPAVPSSDAPHLSNQDAAVQCSAALQATNIVRADDVTAAAASIDVDMQASDGAALYNVTPKSNMDANTVVASGSAASLASTGSQNTEIASDDAATVIPTTEIGHARPSETADTTEAEHDAAQTPVKRERSPSEYSSSSPEPEPLGPDGFPLPTAEEVEEEEAREARDMAQLDGDQSEFATFVSATSGRSLAEMQAEVAAEVESLRAEHARTRRSEEDVTQQMASEVQTLLSLFGIPYVTAPMEAEAQCAKLAQLGLVDGIITDDSDVFLFGGTPVYRHMFNANKDVESYFLRDIQRELGLDRDRLIELALLLGSDYTEGLSGVGPVLAMEILSLYSGNGGLAAFREWWGQVQIGADMHDGSKVRRRIKRALRERVHLSDDWPDENVRDAYVNPLVDSSDEQFVWGHADLDGLRAFLREFLGWTSEKTDEYVLPVIEQQRKTARQHRMQTTLHQAGFVAGEMRMRTSGSTYASARLQQVVRDFRRASGADNAGAQSGAAANGDDANDDDDDGDSNDGSATTGASRSAPPNRRRTKRPRVLSRRSAHLH